MALLALVAVCAVQPPRRVRVRLSVAVGAPPLAVAAFLVLPVPAANGAPLVAPRLSCFRCVVHAVVIAKGTPDKCTKKDVDESHASTLRRR